MTDTMKNNIALIILLIAFLPVACNERQSNNRQLILADSLMQSRPDSACRIFQWRNLLHRLIVLIMYCC